VQCDLPKGLKGVDLDLSEDNLILAMPGHLNLNVDLPKAVDPERFSPSSTHLDIARHFCMYMDYSYVNLLFQGSSKIFQEIKRTAYKHALSSRG